MLSCTLLVVSITETTYTISDADGGAVITVPPRRTYETTIINPSWTKFPTVCWPDRPGSACMLLWPKHSVTIPANAKEEK